MEIYALSVSQVCPQAADVVEVFIYLGEPCHACQLLLTISHGADDSTYPATVDVRTGRSLDGLKLVVEVCISLPYMFLFLLYIHVCPLQFTSVWGRRGSVIYMVKRMRDSFAHLLSKNMLSCSLLHYERNSPIAKITFLRARKQFIYF